MRRTPQALRLLLAAAALTSAASSWGAFVNVDAQLPQAGGVAGEFGRESGWHDGIYLVPNRGDKLNAAHQNLRGTWWSLLPLVHPFVGSMFKATSGSHRQHL